MHYSAINGCRLCGSQDLSRIFDFGEVPLANNLRNNPNDREITSPLEVIMCNECNCFQLLHDVDSNVMFSNYNYQTSNGLQEHFAEYAKVVAKHARLHKSSFIVGIGGNTGVLENEFIKLGYPNVLNVEPAYNIAKLANDRGVNTICNFFNPQTANFIVKKYGKADLITSNNCLAHTDLIPVVAGIRELLSDTGTLVFENAYWPKSLESMDLFQIYCEHLFYHTVKPLRIFFESQGLFLYKVEFNNIQNGSLRGYVAKSPDRIDDSVEKAIKAEEDAGIFNLETYKKINEKMEWLRRAVQTKIFQLKVEGKSISIYGVTAKLVLMLQHFDIQDAFDYAVDDSVLKVGKYVPGTEIKIENRQYFIDNPTDYCLIGAYNLSEFIMKSNSYYNGVWIKPLPILEFMHEKI